jgi:hypothetical protein
VAGAAMESAIGGLGEFFWEIPFYINSFLEVK